MIRITESTEISVYADKLDEARRLVAETMRDSQDYPVFTEREISRLKEMKAYLEAIADRLRMVAVKPRLQTRRFDMEKNIEVKLLNTCVDKLQEAKQLILEPLYESREEPVFSHDVMMHLRHAANAISRRLEAKEGK